jgi:hypothetical protein
LNSVMTSMNPLHDYIASQISDRLKTRRVVVMYDKREELRPFFNELAAETADGQLVSVKIGQSCTSLTVRF